MLILIIIDEGAVGGDGVQVDWIESLPSAAFGCGGRRWRFTRIRPRSVDLIFHLQFVDGNGRFFLQEHRPLHVTRWKCCSQPGRIQLNGSDFWATRHQPRYFRFNDECCRWGSFLYYKSITSKSISNANAALKQFKFSRFTWKRRLWQRRWLRAAHLYQHQTQPRIQLLQKKATIFLQEHHMENSKQSNCLIEIVKDAKVNHKTLIYRKRVISDRAPHWAINSIQHSTCEI